MRSSEYTMLCYRTEQREERVPLKNTGTGEVGFSFQCSYERGGITVQMADGTLETWGSEECREEVMN